MVGFCDNQILIYGFYNKEDLQTKTGEHQEAEGLLKKTK